MSNRNQSKRQRKHPTKPAGPVVQTRPQRSVRSGPIHSMVHRMSSRDRKTSSSRPQRVSSETPVEVSEETSSLGQSLISLNTTYTFRLAGHTFLSSTSGVIDTFFPCDPSASGINFPEWSTLSALFSEFKLIEYGVQFVRGAYTNATASLAPAMICGNLGTAVAPGSYANVADNADSKFWSFLGDNSARGYTHRITQQQTRSQGIQWSQVTTPTTEPYAGAPGAIQIYASGGSGNQTGLIHVLVWGVYEFRSRV